MKGNLERINAQTEATDGANNGDLEQKEAHLARMCVEFEEKIQKLESMSRKRYLLHPQWLLT